MIRTATMFVALMAIGFVLGCSSDKPQPVAQNNGGTTEQGAGDVQKENTGQTQAGQGDKLAEGLDLSNKTADGRKAGDPKEIRQLSFFAEGGKARSEPAKKQPGGGLGGLGSGDWWHRRESERRPPGTPMQFGAQVPQSRAAILPGLTAGGTTASGPTAGYAVPGRGGEAAGRMKLGKRADGKADGKPEPLALAGEAKPAPQDGHDGANAERYGTYRENEFRSPLVARALDVLRGRQHRVLLERPPDPQPGSKLPPKDAVFLAEFVNYFPYQYAQPKGDDPVAFNLDMGPCPWNRKHHLVRVGVQAYQIPADKMPPRNLVFLIDTSGSMAAAEPPAAREEVARPARRPARPRRTASPS